jgi:hypothetical protein
MLVFRCMRKSTANLIREWWRRDWGSVTIVDCRFQIVDWCDGIVALGGGSPIDTAKMIWVMARNGGEVSRFMGVDKVGKRPGPVGGFRGVRRLGEPSHARRWSCCFGLLTFAVRCQQGIFAIL